MTSVTGLYAITDDRREGPTVLGRRVAAALDGGARAIQYRDKSDDAERRRAEAGTLAELCRHRGIPFIVNDDLELAAALDAGVHIGVDDPSLEEAHRRITGLVGVSCYADFSRAEAAVAAGADYVAFGRFFPSSTKPDNPPADPDLLRRAHHELAVPAVAIGGITPENGGQLVEAGAAALAVIHGVFGQTDITAAARRYTDLFQ
ncbi:MAG: thiamine phosphate synthase [Thiohalospira sp.]